MYNSLGMGGRSNYLIPQAGYKSPYQGTPSVNPYLGDFSGQQIGGDQVTYSGTYFQRPMPFPQYQMPQQQNFLRPRYGRRLGRFTPYLEQAQPFLGIE